MESPFRKLCLDSRSVPEGQIPQRSITSGVDVLIHKSLTHFKFQLPAGLQVPYASFEFLTKFFSQHLPFTPTAGQVADFKSDLALVSPFLMEASLIEVKVGTLGNILVYRPNEWRAAIFKVYYRKVAEHAQLFPVFHSFETAFRSTVALRLEQHYSHKRWWRAVYDAIRKGQAPKTITEVGGVKMTTRAAFLIGKIIDSNDMIAIEGFDNGYHFLNAAR